MRNIATCVNVSTLLLALITLPVSCGGRSDPPPAYAPAQAPGSVTQAPGYGDGTTPTPTPVLAASPVSGAALSTPNALALPCTVDANCLTHRCNVAAQKCAWPCQTDNDCMPGNACISPTCLPKLQ